MSIFPSAVNDVFELANGAISATAKAALPGFGAPVLPSTNGANVRAARIPQERAGFPTRNLIRWFIPETGIVEMYINPQNITYQQKKHITQQRTKGGYVLQYWGEELGTLSINGTTGSAGVEGINVLEDIYRSEQLAFDPFALTLAAQAAEKEERSGSLFGDLLGDISNTFTGLLTDAVKSGTTVPTRMEPTLASLAFSVECYHAGWVYRGYFSDFRVEESADKIGLFNYSMTFIVTQRRGMRLNFFGWHRSPFGPSNSDAQFGPAHSFTHLGTNTPAIAPPRQQNQGGISLLDAFDSLGDTVTSAVGSIF